jgi:hypothetical protein
VFFVFWALVAFLFRQVHMPPLSGRYLFADCKFKHKYRPFWERYKVAYQSVQATRQAPTSVSAQAELVSVADQPNIQPAPMTASLPQ